MGGCNSKSDGVTSPNKAPVPPPAAAPPPAPKPAAAPASAPPPEPKPAPAPAPAPAPEPTPAPPPAVVAPPLAAEVPSSSADVAEPETPGTQQKSFLFVKKLPPSGFGESSVCLDVANGNRPVQTITFDGSRFSARSNKNLGAGSAKNGVMAFAVLKQLNHPNLVKVFKVLQDPKTDKMTLILEYAAGGDLATRAAKRGKIPDVDMKRHARDIVCGITVMHEQKLAHRAICPSNLVLSSEDDVKVIESGNTVFFDVGDTEGYVTGAVGEKNYWAPECFKADSYNAYHADIWALGCTLYELATGGKAFIGTEAATADLPRFPEDLDTSLASLIKECLSQDPKARPQIEDLMSRDWTTSSGTVPLVHAPPSKMIAMKTGFFAKPEVIIDISDVESMFLYSDLPKKDVGEGEYLTRQHDEAEEAYFIEEGEVLTLMDVTGFESSGKKFARRSRLERADLSVHRKGELVGEVALMLDGQKRTASLVAQTNITVLVIHKDRINEILDNDPEVRDHLKKIAQEKSANRKKVTDELKRRLEMELSLGLEDLPELESELEVQSFPTGAVLHTKGEKVSSAWYLSKGSVDLVLEEEGGGRRVIGESGLGGFVGELEIILEKPNRLVTAIATSPVEAFKLRASELRGMLDNNPDAGDMLRDAVEEKMEARDRVAKELKQWLEMKLSLGLENFPDIQVRGDEKQNARKPLSRGLENLPGIQAELNIRATPEGGFLSKEGDAATECYYIKKGKVQLEVTGDEGAEPRSVGTVEEGGFVGEIAIIQGKDKRFVSSRALGGPVEALVLRRSEMERMLASSAELKEKLQAAAAAKIAARDKVSHQLKGWLEVQLGLGIESLPDVLPDLNQLTYQPGEYLTQQGEAASCAFYLASGSVELQRTTDGEMVKVAMVNDGGFVGEIAIMTGEETRFVSALARTVVEVFSISREELGRFMSKLDPEAAAKLIAAAKAKRAKVPPDRYGHPPEGEKDEAPAAAAEGGEEAAPAAAVEEESAPAEAAPAEEGGEAAAEEAAAPAEAAPAAEEAAPAAEEEKPAEEAAAPAEAAPAAEEAAPAAEAAAPAEAAEAAPAAEEEKPAEEAAAPAAEEKPAEPAA